MNNKDDSLLQIVTFSLNKEEFGVDILKVHEINRLMEITRVPRAPAFVDGVINLRGKIIPIVNLRKRFELSPLENDKDTRIIIMEVHDIIVGFIVDRVSEVLRLPANIVEAAPPVISGIDADYISGIGKLNDRLLIMLDLEKVISASDINHMQQLQQLTQG